MTEDTSTESAAEGAADDAEAKPAEPETSAKAAKSAKAQSKEERIISNFTRLTGYEEEDVLDVNEQTRTVVTSNGGKYQLTGKGGVRTISGPPTPAETEEAAEAAV